MEFAHNQPLAILALQHALEPAGPDQRDVLRWRFKKRGYLLVAWPLKVDLPAVQAVSEQVVEATGIQPVWRILQVAPVLLRSEEHTSELQSRRDLVCRLLLEKKKKI